MENLAHLQSWLRWVITHPNGVRPALQNANGQEPQPRALEAIVEAPPLDRLSRLDIYAEGYFARLVEVLTSDFETLHRVLETIFDEQAFRKVISAYLAAYPSKTRTVCDVGQWLPQFLESYEPLAEHPALAEIAKMDWCATRTLYIDALPAFDPSSLAELTEADWVQLKFELDTTVHFLSSTHSVDRVWNETELDFASIEAVPTELLIFRQQEFVFVERLSHAQLFVLQAMRAGKTLGEICTELESQAENEMPPIMEWFSQWVGNGVIRSARF